MTIGVRYAPRRAPLARLNALAEADLFQGRGVHHNARVTCGEWMPKAAEFCARRRGHRDTHRSRYALDNAKAMRSGRGLL